MIRIEPGWEPTKKVDLGTILEYRIVRQDPTVLIRSFVKHQRVFYMKPLNDWNEAESFLFFPEAPGTYTLAVQWRGPAGETGWQEVRFEVSSGRPTSAEPYQIQLDETTRIWAPSEWEARLARSSAEAMLEALPEIVESGAVVYDVGANLGLYALRMARLAGPSGHVYCVEANPLCVHFLNANLELNGIENASVIPAALLDRPGETHFAINYGNANLGMSEVAGLYGSKVGHEIQVASCAFDQLVEEYGLKPPDVVKIDVEGAEEFVIRGMARTLAVWKPILALELHGYAAAATLLGVLEAAGYRFRDPQRRVELASGQAVWEHFGYGVFQLIAQPAEVQTSVS